MAPPHPLFQPPPLRSSLVLPALPIAMRPAHSPNTSHPQASGRVAFRSDAEPHPKMHQESTLLKSLLKSAAAGASSLPKSRACQHRSNDRPKRDASTGVINWDTLSNKLKQVVAWARGGVAARDGLNCTPAPFGCLSCPLFPFAAPALRTYLGR